MEEKASVPSFLFEENNDMFFADNLESNYKLFTEISERKLCQGGKEYGRKDLYF